MKKLKAIFFLISFGFSIMGHTLELHYCKGEVTDVSLIGHADCYCGVSHIEVVEKESETPCEKHCHENTDSEKKSQTELTKENCCKTEKLTFLSPSIKALSNTEIPIWTSCVVLLNPAFSIKKVDELFINQSVYIPPILDRDITILIQSFLI